MVWQGKRRKQLPCDDVNEHFPAYRCQGDTGHTGIHWAGHEDGVHLACWLEPGPDRPFAYASKVERPPLMCGEGSEPVSTPCGSAEKHPRARVTEVPSSPRCPLDPA